MRLADLHYRDVCDYGVGRGTSAGWAEDEDGIVRRVWTEPMPTAHVERVVPNEKIDDVERGTEVLAELAAASGDQLAASLSPLVTRYRSWIEMERQRAKKLVAPARRETATQLVVRTSAAWTCECTLTSALADAARVRRSSVGREGSGHLLRHANMSPGSPACRWLGIPRLALEEGGGQIHSAAKAGFLPSASIWELAAPGTHRPSKTRQQVRF